GDLVLALAPRHVEVEHRAALLRDDLQVVAERPAGEWSATVHRGVAEHADLRRGFEPHEHVRPRGARRREQRSLEESQVEQVEHAARERGHEPLPERRFRRGLRVAETVLEKPRLDAVAHHPLGAGLALRARRQRVATARWHALSGPVVDPDIGEATERAGQRQASGAHDRIHEVLQGLAEERGGRLLLESPLEWARSDETEPAHEDRSQGRERERLAYEEALDHREHQPKRGAVPLSRVVSGARAQLVDHGRHERPPHLILDGLRLRGRLWTGRCGSGSSRLHRGPLVGGVATEPTMSGPDLFPLSRYVTRKGSGHEEAPQDVDCRGGQTLPWR